MTKQKKSRSTPPNVGGWDLHADLLLFLQKDKKYWTARRSPAWTAFANRKGWMVNAVRENCMCRRSALVPLLHSDICLSLSFFFAQIKLVIDQMGIICFLPQDHSTIFTYKVIQFHPGSLPWILHKPNLPFDIIKPSKNKFCLRQRDAS